MTSSDHQPISAEARGQLRIIKRDLALRWQQFDQTFRSPTTRALIREFAGRGSVIGRRRAFRALNRRLTPPCLLHQARLLGKAPLAVWAVLKPRDGVRVDPKTPSEAQDCITVDYLVGGMVFPRGPFQGDGIWTLEVTDHALGRLLQRDPGEDLPAVIMAAHHAVLNIRLHNAQTYFAGEGSFRLPAGNGEFRCVGVSGFDVSRANEPMLHIRALTWLHRDQLQDEPPDPPVSDDEPRLGDSFLLPAPLRMMEAEIIDGIMDLQVAIPPPGMGMPLSDHYRPPA
jgi:hypothetical protein